ncbi:uncharacterized protein LOC128483838 [Spea bombifrons]|uniref:uncharacterized protein LOC128483838 n=1 Tax=Spea bombifrons TaxID=233779 RepID=UPI00234AD535|nr:uncharacterized protein LOC128483838 [Spea bombifrons]
MVSGENHTDHGRLLTKILSQTGNRNSKSLSVSSARQAESVTRPHSPTDDHQEMLRSCRYITELNSDDAQPDWVVERSKVRVGELTFFKQNLLSSKQVKQLDEISLPRLKPSRPESGPLYARIEKPHQYLKATLPKSSVNELDIGWKPQITTYNVQFGRPTRSSLLRSGHQSAAVTRNIPAKHELQKPPLESCAGRTLKQSKRLQTMSLGETDHSFLVGARYNRKYLDSQAFQKYGLFISRSKHGVTFLTQCTMEHKKSSTGVKDLMQDSVDLDIHHTLRPKDSGEEKRHVTSSGFEKQNKI